MKETHSVFLKLTSAIVLDGRVVRAGSLVEVTNAEAKNLLHRNKAVLATEKDGAPARAELREDGPTIEEFVAAGYRVEAYPPEGYAPRSTDDEIKAAAKAQAAADKAAAKAK